MFDGKKQKMTSFDGSQPASAASYTNWSTVKGVRDDVNLIVGQTLKLFDDTQTLRIQHFQTVWKSMKFGLVSTYFKSNHIQLLTYEFSFCTTKEGQNCRFIQKTLKLFDDTQTLRIQHFQTVRKSM